MNESLNHQLTQSVQKRRFVQKLSKWSQLFISHWIIDSLNSFKQLHKPVTLFMNESLNHWLTQFVQMPDLFRTEASDSLNECVIESLINPNHTKTDLFRNEVTAFINDSLNHWLARLVQKHRFIQNRSQWLSLWTSHWITDSLDSFKNVDLFRNKGSHWIYKRVTESFTHLIR